MWPADGLTEDVRQRLHAYTEKAVREAGVHTTWFDNNTAFETAISNWVDAVIDGPAASMIQEFVEEIHRGAIQISLGRKLLQLIGPGIPDTYQGQEFLDFSLVDPDNRRFVDYIHRSQTLQQYIEEGITDSSDRLKQAVVYEGLQIRRERPEVFGANNYRAVFAEGEAAHHLLGLRRGNDVIALATRSPLGLEDRGGWGDTTATLPEGTWTNRLNKKTFTGTVPVSELLGAFPTALLVAER